MKKRFLFPLLALVLLISLPRQSLAVDSLSDQGKLQILQEEGVIEGDEHGNLGLDRPISRAEMSKVLVVLNDLRIQADQLAHRPSKYKDVAPNHWANGYISILSSLKSMGGTYLLQGCGDGTFQPEKEITYGEVSKIAVVTATSAMRDFNGNHVPWPQGWMNMAKYMNLESGKKAANIPAIRRDVFVTLYDTFYTNPASRVSKDVLIQMAGGKPGEEVKKPGEKPKKPDAKSKMPQKLQGLMNGFNDGSSFDHQAYEREMLRLVNQARRENGLAPVTSADYLREGTATRARELAQHGSLYVNGIPHVRLDGSLFETVFTGPPSFILGENLHQYAGPYQVNKTTKQSLTDPVFLARYFFNWWMTSPTHRGNILNPNITHVNVAVYAGEKHRDIKTRDNYILVTAMIIERP